MESSLFRKPKKSALRQLGEFGCYSIKNYFEVDEVIIAGLEANKLRIILKENADKDWNKKEYTIERINGRLFLRMPDPDAETFYLKLVNLYGRNKMLSVHNHDQELIIVYGEGRGIERAEKEVSIYLPLTAIQYLGKAEDIQKALSPILSHHKYRAVLSHDENLISLELHANFPRETTLEEVVRKNRKVQRLSNIALSGLLR